jgi:thiamine biosynthesis lipoprotein ApbE/Fe2+ transport system protein FeoA
MGLREWTARRRRPRGGGREERRPVLPEKAGVPWLAPRDEGWEPPEAPIEVAGDGGDPLLALPSGAEANVESLGGGPSARLGRLSSYGLAPGARVRLVQKRPAVVVEVDGTRLAIERGIAARIRVRRVAPALLLALATGAAASSIAAETSAAAPVASGAGGAGRAAGAGFAAPLVEVARARHVMGSPLEIRTFAEEADRARVGAALDAALDEVERLDALLSNWRSDSEVAALNRRAAAGPVPLSEDLFAVLAAAMEAQSATGGSFDPGLSPWIDALGLRSIDLDSAAPTAGGEVPALPPRAGQIQLDPVSRTARFTSADVGVDLGGIGKGYALDRAARRLKEAGIDSALLNFGGQVLAVGAPPGETGWIVEVADPRDRLRPALDLRLRDASAATSANTERGVMRAGRWIGHVLDPGSGRPAPFPGSATAVAPDATRADAYATALLVMGPERGLDWAESREDVAAVFLDPAAAGPPLVRATLSLERYRGPGHPAR